MIYTALGIVLIWAGAVLMLQGLYQWLCYLLCSLTVGDQFKPSKFSFSFGWTVTYLPFVLILAGILVLVLP